MANVEPTSANAAVPPADGRGAGEFTVPITLTRRDATPEQHADALLASLGFDAADLARYREQTGVDLRQHFVNSFRNAPRQSHNHYANGRRIDVTFAWIKNNDGVVRLVTSIPAKK